MAAIRFAMQAAALGRSFALSRSAHAARNSGFAAAAVRQQSACSTASVVAEISRSSTGHLLRSPLSVLAQSITSASAFTQQARTLHATAVPSMAAPALNSPPSLTDSNSAAGSLECSGDEEDEENIGPLRRKRKRLKDDGRIYILSSAERVQPPLSTQDSIFLWKRSEEMHKLGGLVRARLGQAGPTRAWLSRIGDLLAAHELIRVSGRCLVREPMDGRLKHIYTSTFVWSFAPRLRCPQRMATWS